MGPRVLCSTDLRVEAVDERGAGHANHEYRIRKYGEAKPLLTIFFQKGPIQENGINGVQNEELLMVVIDRLIGFQTGEFACDENEEALRHLISAASILQLRTAKRKARGVEGKSVV